MGCGEGSMMKWEWDLGQAPRVSAPLCHILAVQLWADGRVAPSPSGVPASALLVICAPASVTCTAMVDSEPGSSLYPPCSQPPGTHSSCLVSLLQQFLDFCGFFFFFFWPHHGACGVLVPQPGVEPAPSAVRAWSPNHWTAREFPQTFIKVPEL